MKYDDALGALYRAPFDEFVVARKRLAADVKAAGDKAGATALGKRARPTSSAWAVNQLWWHDRAAFDALLASAEQLRGGELAANAAHREATAKLRAAAAKLLGDPSEAVLRRVMTTLAAIAAAGGFAPDEPGMLVKDRDPPGFEGAGILGDVPAAPAPVDNSRREAAALAARKAERARLESALETARGEVESCEREVQRARAGVERAERDLEKARAIVADLEARVNL
ncbi:MAG TPA: hypothetical protein VGM88_06700 [Kofleriaceae bacterium]